MVVGQPDVGTPARGMFSFPPSLGDISLSIRALGRWTGTMEHVVLPPVDQLPWLSSLGV